MKKRIATLGITVATAVLIVGNLRVAHAQTTSATNPSTPTKKVEKFPAINRAIIALEQAKMELQDPKNNFGSQPQRQEAISACNKAELQLRSALGREKQPQQ